MSHVFKGWLFTALCLFSLEGHTMWAKMTEAQLLEYSPLIITGELLGESEVRGMVSNEAVNLGVIRVDKVLKGKVEGSLVFLALPSRVQPRSSSMIDYQVGAKGLWYLRHRSEGDTIYLADHPQRFVDESVMNEKMSNLQPQR